MQRSIDNPTHTSRNTPSRKAARRRPVSAVPAAGSAAVNTPAYAHPHAYAQAHPAQAHPAQAHPAQAHPAQASVYAQAAYAQPASQPSPHKHGQGHPGGERTSHSPGKKPPKKGKTALSILLVLAILAAVVLAAVRLVTGDSLFKILSAATDDDYTPTVDGDMVPLEEGGSVFNGLTGTGGGELVRKSYNFLLCGVNTNLGMNNSDTMMVLNFNVESGEINLVQLPRDSYFSYYKEKHNFHKINSYYTAYYNKAKSAGKSNEEAIRAGMTELRSFLEDVFCIKLDYYVYLDLKAFVKIVDAVGGVTVNVPRDMHYDDDPGGLHIHLNKGVQHLSGDQAIQFVRFRKGYVNSDYGRMDAQKIFMSAFISQVKENLTLTKAVSIAETVFNYDNLITDLSAADFVYFAKQGYGCDTSKITMQTLPSGGAMAADGLWYDVVCLEEAVQTINRALNVYENLTVSLEEKEGCVVFDKNAILYDHDSEKQKKIYFGSAEDGVGEIYTADDAGDRVHLQ